MNPSYDPEKHHRRSVRLRIYDYSRSGAYFITVCTKGQELLFGEVNDGKVELNELGRFAAEEWLKSARIRIEIELDAWVLMPNHVHGIVIITDDLCTGDRPVARTEVKMMIMTSDLKRYPAYKDSGVEWLGKVPTHWEVERGKWLFRKMDRPVREADEVVTCFRDGAVTLRKNRRVRGFTESLKEIGYQGIRCGDLVIHGMDAFAGAIGVADSNGKGTPVYSVCEPGPTARAEYFAHALREMARSQWIQALTKGIRERSTDFRFESFGSQKVPLPPLSEQAAIVRFLDHVDRRIRRYIRAKQKLIAVLEEQKQASIHQAVTRGLNPNVRLKPSGVDWMGDVPEHWEVRRLETVAEMRVSNVDKHTREDELPVRLCNYVDVYKNDRITQEISFMKATASQDGIERFHLKQGDVLITKDSEAWDDIGVPALVMEPADDLISGYHLALLRPFKQMQGAYLAWTLQSQAVAHQFHIEAKGVTRYGLTHAGIRSVNLLLPSHPEQTAIVMYLDKTSAAIDTSISRTYRQMELLREYRTRLIADVVTGKLDVREAAAGLPGEGDEAEPIDGSSVLVENMDVGAGLKPAPTEKNKVTAW